MNSIRLTFTSRRRWEERNSASLENTEGWSILEERDWALNKGVGVEKRAAFLCYYVGNSSMLMISFNREQLYRRCYCPECADKNTEVPGG